MNIFTLVSCRPHVSAFALLVACTLSAITPARAADGTWLGNSGTWSNTVLWSGGIVADGTNSRANFTGVNITASRFITNDAPRTLGGINFTDAVSNSHDLTISGSTITLEVTSGTPQINVTNQNLTLTNTLAGTQGFVKNGGGTLIVRGNNTGLVGGNVTVNNGALRLATSGNALGGASGPVILLGSTLASSTSPANLDGGNSITIANAIIVQAGPTSPGTRTIGSSGNINPNFSGNITVNENLRVLQDNPSGSVTISGAGKTIASGKTVSFNANETGTLSDNGLWSGDGAISYSTTTSTPGGGPLNIGGQKTHTGGSQLLSMAGNTNTPSTAIVTASSTGTPGSPTSGPFGVGTLTLSVGRLRAGTAADISIDNVVSIIGNMTFPSVTDEKSLTFTGPATLNTNRTLTVDVGTNVPGKFVRFAGAIGQSFVPSSLTKAGAGVLVLDGDNTFTGNTAISAGTLQLGSAGTLTNSPVITLATNTVLDVTAKAGGFVILSNRTLTVTGGTVAGAMSVSGLLNVASNGKIDATTVDDGGRVGLTGGPAAATNLTFAASGSMSFNVAGGGSLTVTGTDGVTNNGGAGSIIINITGSVAPAGGTNTLIAYSGTLQGSGGFAAYELGTTPPGATYALLDSPGAVQLVVTPSLTWTGLESSEWSINELVGLLNWQFGGVATNYQDGLPVVFSDSLTGTNVVDISVADVSPGTIVFNNTLTNYFLRGSKGIVGGSTFNKLGTNALTIENDNAFTGPTVIGAGQLILGSGGTSGSISNTTVITNNGALIVNRSNTIGMSSPIVGTGTVTKQGAGTLVLSATNTYNGATLVSAGTLKLGASDVLPNGSGKTGVTVNGIFDLNGFSETINGLAGSGVVDNTGAAAATLTVGGNNSSSTFNGIISNSVGTLNLTKIGTGVTTLSNANTFSGSVNITAGALALGNLNTLNNVSNITIAGGARLQPNLSNIVLNVPITLGSNGTTATINAPAAGLGGEFYPFTLNGVISGAGNVLFNSLNGANSFGTIILNAQNTYGGSTRLDCSATNAACFVQLGTNNALPVTTVLILDGGPGAGSGRFVEVNLNGFDQTLAGLTNILNTPRRQQRVINNSVTPATLTINNTADFTYLGQLANVASNGNFSLVKNGPGTFTLDPSTTGTNGTTILNNFYTGGTVVNAGTLLVNNSNGSGTGSGAVTVDGGTLGGNGIISGAVTVNVGGTFSPGTSIGTLTINNNLTLAGTTIIEVNKTGGTRDQVVGIANATYGGTLVVSNLAGTLAAGDSFAIFTAASASGNFASITPAPGPGLAWNFNPGTGVLTVVSTFRLLTFTSNGSGGISASGSGGAPFAPYVIVTETNMTVPLVSWIPILTNAFDAGGNFSITISNALLTPDSRRFFRMVTP